MRRKYFAILVAVLAFTVVVNGVLAHFFIQRTSDLVGRGIADILSMNRNEFLDEIALKDHAALNQHLQILRHRLNVDEVSLTIEEGHFSSQRPPAEKSLFASALRPWVSVPPVRAQIASDYGGFPAAIEVKYADLILTNTVLPLIQQIVVTTIGVLLIIAWVFGRSFKQIRQVLIQPLRDLSSHFRDSTTAGPVVAVEDSLAEIRDLQEALQNYNALAKKQLFAEVASQVAHDIRSPLSALAVVSQDLSSVPENRRAIIRMAIQRIQDIADNLIRTHRTVMERKPTSADPASSVLLASVLETLIAEKQAQYGARPGIFFTLEREPSLWNLSAYAQGDQLMRVLSNLMNNAVEAIPDSGTISVRLAHKPGRAVIEVVDDGVGIPANRLSGIFERGASRKIGGSGLGLSHAKASVEGWGGGIRIESRAGHGTRVEIELRQAESPAWLPTEIALPEKDGKLVLVDDEPLVHEAWKERLRPLGITPLSFDSLRALEARPDVGRAPENRFLFDFEFYGSESNGLDAIERLQLASRSVLVTGQSLRPDILARSVKLGVKLLPKELIAQVPLKVGATSAGIGV
jgi:signal transduction histidine kinase